MQNNYKVLNLWKLFKKKSASEDRYNLTWKNCKSLARTLIYFAYQNYENDKVIDSLLGLFIDKPGYIPYPMSVAYEYIVWDAIFKGLDLKDVTKAIEVLTSYIQECKK